MKALTILLALLVIGVSFSVCGQELQIAEIRKYIAHADPDEYKNLSSVDLRNISLSSFIETTASYLNDSNVNIRYRAIDLIRKKGLLLATSDEKKLITALLTEACKDTDSGNSGVASRALLLYSPEDFTEGTTDSLVTLLNHKPFFYERILRMAGFLNTDNLTEALNELKTSDSSLSVREQWSLELALARTGNRESIVNCMQKISEIPVNDASVAYLFPDLLYMRCPESLNFMLHEVLSDDKKCRSPNPDKEQPVICAFKIIELLAPVIEDFPVNLTAYGELDTENYDTTLVSVREWTMKHPNFSIITTIY
jgi:hypothetical protein